MPIYGGLEYLDSADLGRAVGLELDPWQIEIMDTEQDTLINVNRQAGKSTTSALRAYSSAAFHPGFTGILISPSLRQSGEIFRKVIEFHRKLGLVNAIRETQLTLELENYSRIISLPGAENTVRGISAVDLIVADEASRIEDEIYVAIAPMLAVSNGTILAPSTPAGMRGWWHDAWHMGGDYWHRIHVTAEDCPRISRNFLKAARATFGEHAYRQEYLGEFLANSDALFRPEDLADAFRKTKVKPLDVDSPVAGYRIVTRKLSGLEL